MVNCATETRSNPYWYVMLEVETKYYIKYNRVCTVLNECCGMNGERSIQLSVQLKRTLWNGFQSHFKHNCGIFAASSAPKPTVNIYLLLTQPDLDVKKIKRFRLWSTKFSGPPNRLWFVNSLQANQYWSLATALFICMFIVKSNFLFLFGFSLVCS